MSEKFTMKEVAPIAHNELPRGIYDEIITGFLNSGAQTVVIHVPDRSVVTVYNSLYRTINRKYPGSGIWVSKRGNDVYIGKDTDEK